jgi:hypothetical protein
LSASISLIVFLRVSSLLLSILYKNITSL